ncbi:hypothetical protein [Roseateles sp. P5_E8]
MDLKIHVSNVEDVRKEFAARGLSVSEWARVQGVSAALTYQILSGSRPLGRRGQSHRISVLLGLKAGIVASAVHELEFVHTPTVDADRRLQTQEVAR